MSIGDYDFRVRSSLRRVWKPGQTLRAVAVWTVDPWSGYECELCGWPRTSASACAPGLRHVVVLQNDQTRATLRVGTRCARNCLRHMQAQDPGARIAGLEEALAKLARGEQAVEAVAAAPFRPSLHPPVRAGVEDDDGQDPRLEEAEVLRRLGEEEDDEDSDKPAAA